MNRIFISISLFLFSAHAFSALLSYNDLIGTWRLKYKRNYGYEFRFHNNYRAFCILYHGTNALVFKGIYSIIEDKLRININEMKNEQRIRRIDFQKRFVKTSSSYFIFNVELQKKGKNKTLILKPLKIKTVWSS